MGTNTTEEEEPPTSDKQTFYQYVSERMSHADFNTLHQKLGFTKRKTTTYLYYPYKINFELLERLSAILEEDLTAVVEEFQIGAAVYTHQEYKKLTQAMLKKSV
jgi:hypothetical protein